MNYQKLFKFYRDCYEADTRTLSLTNVFSTKFENRYFIFGKDELINQHLPSIPIDAKIAKPILENIGMYAEEKSLSRAPINEDGSLR